MTPLVVDLIYVQAAAALFQTLITLVVVAVIYTVIGFSTRLERYYHISMLPSRAFDSEKDVGDCPICLESYCPKNSVKTLPCNHKYHSSCIDAWLKRKDTTCPMCRKAAIKSCKRLKRSWLM